MNQQIPDLSNIVYIENNTGIIKITETECLNEYIIYNGNYDYEGVQTYSG